jgi:glycosyltransferase involved in cell wall biosynthesis
MSKLLKQFLPSPIWNALRPPALVVRRLRSLAALRAVAAAPLPHPGTVHVNYGLPVTARARGVQAGGIVKFGSLARLYPHKPWIFNLLYLGSSALPPDAVRLAEVAHRKGAKIVWNQNGVGYPAWAPDHWADVNAPMKALIAEADHVFYQSEFCKLSADRFLGEPRCPSEILYNPVDTERFCPNPEPHLRVPALLLHAGTVKAYYRFETAVLTLAELVKMRVPARLVFAGRFDWSNEPEQIQRDVSALVTSRGLGECVEMLPPYSRLDAPSVFRRCHILLHTKVNDPCPTVVLEAMSAGLPVVFAESGGVPELVGNQAGIGVRDWATWEQDVPPDPRALAEAVVSVLERYEQYAAAARVRAIERFDAKLWVNRHRQVFENLLA